ncbi:MAG TPA: GntR family transcriptional regulator, partial [Acidimicrobiales bacterium]|nr:GntR family transcriptional regulator [Acidimicrobiales bacterium]
MDLLIDLDPATGRRQGIEAALRAAIREGRLAAGSVLPSSRALAADLGVARGTVVDAYDQLLHEGWLAARPGSRTVVAAAAAHPTRPPAAVADVPVPAIDLRAGAPDLTTFPAATWAAAVRRVLRSGSGGLLDYAPARGRPELRAALAAYLGRARGVM